MGFRLVGAVLLASIGLEGVIEAQPYTHLAGLIRDPSDAAVPGALVSVVSEDTGFRRATRSRSDGSYVVVSLDPGLYKITVRKEGFRTLIRLGVRLSVAEPARVDFALPLGSMQETITVNGSPPVLGTEDASIGTVVSGEQIRHLPLNGRGLLGLLELAPGLVVTPATRGEAGQFSSAGQRPNTNYFTVDGVSANTGVSAGGLPAQSTGGSLPAMTALGSLHSLLSLEAIDEFRVQTSTTAPEFGRLPGAQVVLSSRSGSNEFRGSLFDYMRHEALDANDWFANRHGDAQSPTRMQNFGGSLGGPAKRNQTFFFLSYEGMRLRQPLTWRAAVPDVAARAAASEWVRPVFDLFPLPNGSQLGPGMAEWVGINNRPSRFDSGNLRIDHALTSHLTLFGRLSAVPSWSEFGGAQISRVSIDSRGLTIGLNARLNSSAVLDVRMNGSEANLHSAWTSAERPSYSPCDLAPVLYTLTRAQGACGYLFRFSIAGAGQVVLGREGDQRQAQLHVAPALALTLGRHEVRLGGDYVRLNPTRHDTSSSLGVIAENLADLIKGANLWTAASDPQSREIVLKEASVFAQDAWRISRRLTASFGVRWELTPSPELKLGPASGFLLSPPSAYNIFQFPDQRNIWVHPYTNFAPRVGVAYRPFAGGRTVLRAGWGVYYDSSFSIATDLVNGGPFSLAQYGSAVHAPFVSTLGYGFMPGLRLPSVRQWSAMAEHALGQGHLISAAYVGSTGRRLLRRELGGFQNTETLHLALATNNGFSRYDGLQLQYRMRPWHGFDGLASYAWSHSIDDSSTDSVLHWAGSGVTAARDRGSSDFDVRHAFTAAFGYERPRAAASALLRGWRMDGILRARTGFPITVLDADYVMGLNFANVFRPDLVPGQPVWIADSSAPGGRRLNPAAFQVLPNQAQGNLGRNAISGLGMYQIDLALSRDFPLSEHRTVQLRIDAFNALNHPSFADPWRFLSSPLFGQSLSMLNLMLGTGSPGSGLTPVFQTGGARSLQAMFRFRF